MHKNAQNMHSVSESALISGPVSSAALPLRQARHHLVEHCPVEAAISRIGGKWKALIILRLLVRTRRFNELQRSLPGCTQRMLTNQLRDLEADNLVRREVFAEIPPRVEYSLTPAGQALEPVLRAMCEWGQVQVMREPADFEKMLAAVR